MLATDLIAAKRGGHEHTREQLDGFVQGVTSGSIPDYQVAAWLMAVCFRGMTSHETEHLTQAMARSGKTLDLQARWPNVVDKHSTGGVGDKTSLVLMPMLAAAGWRVAKMSGRGLGFSGGTIDKMEAIPGLRAELSEQEFLDQVDRIGIAITAQSPAFAPADGGLYALRDVTATVDSIPLIASSIMSKKLALRASRLVLDVKTGSGAFMKTEDVADELARAMVAIGRAAGILTSAVISEMSQPEGCAVGNALEVREVVEVLRGRGPEEVLDLAEILAGSIGITGLRETIADGSAFRKLCEMVYAQGGDVRALEEPDRLPAARLRRQVLSPRAGYVSLIDAEAIGRASVALGAGRQAKGDAIDPATGLVLHVKVGSWVEAGATLAELHANDEARIDGVLSAVAGAFSFSDEPVEAPALVKRVIAAA